MTDTRRSEPTSRAARTQDALNRIGSWLLDVVKAEPGWSEMILDVKPLAGQVYIRVREFRDGEEYIGSVGPPRKIRPYCPIFASSSAPPTTATAAPGLPHLWWWRPITGPNRSSVWGHLITATKNRRTGVLREP